MRCLLCKAGEAFVRWLVKDSDAADRIPRKNVLNAKSGSAVARAIGPSLAVQILAYLSPAVIGASRDAEKDFRGYLGEIEINVSVDWMKEILAPDTVKPIGDLAIDIPEKYIHHYIEKLPKEIKPEQFHAAIGAATWKGRIQGFARLKDVLRVLALLSALAEHEKESDAAQTGWDRLSQGLEEIETPVKVAEFLTAQSATLVRSGFFGEFESIEKTIAEKMVKRGYHHLGTFEKQIVRSCRLLSAVRILGAAEKLLAGPIGLIIGGGELLTQSHEASESAMLGDINAATAHSIKATAGALICGVSAMECLGIVGERFGIVILAELGEVAWLGPVGWIAAGLMLIGEIFLAYGKKSDFELFAAHCFLGIDAGRGGTEAATKYPWMGEVSWSELKEPQKARLALLRLVSGFSVWMGLNVERGAFWQIKASYIPAGACFEVEVHFTSEQDKSVKVTRTGTIWPDDGNDGKLSMTDGFDSSDCKVKVRRTSDGTFIDVNIRPQSATADHHSTWKLYVRVRLVFDGNNALPVKGWVENVGDSVSSVSTSGE